MEIGAHPKRIRRAVITVLYHSYQRDPMHMLTPSDIADAGELPINDLAASCHYLHDRKLIELMMGYNPPLFAAARIAPEGIDLCEDRVRFERIFPQGPTAKAEDTSEIVSVMMALGEQAERAPLEGLRKEWLLRDVSRLRELLRKPEADWDAEALLNAVQWLQGFAASPDDLPALGDIEDLLAHRFR